MTPELVWKCDGECKEELDEYAYAMIISNVQVLEVDDKGRITTSQSTGQQDEQLCWSCFAEKHIDPAKTLEGIKTYAKALIDTAKGKSWVTVSAVLTAKALLDMIEGTGE